MISAQCDKLRERAAELRSLAPDSDVPYLVPSTKETMALAMGSAASEMEYAADLILELRDDLQRSDEAVRDAEHDESMAWVRVRKAEAESAKLRETCDELREACAELLDMAESHDPEWLHWPEMYEELRKLGVDV